MSHNSSLSFRERKLMQIAEQILNEAFWGDYDFTAEDIYQTFSHRQPRDKNTGDVKYAIWQKAFFNMKDPYVLLYAYGRETMAEYLKKVYKNQRFPHLKKRILLWHNYLLGENNDIAGLKWYL